MQKFISTGCVLLSNVLWKPKMPAFTLYGSRGSTNTDRVRLTLAEGGFTDYEFVYLNLQKGEQKVRDPVISSGGKACPRLRDLYSSNTRCT
jgi:hypothetical protein